MPEKFSILDYIPYRLFIVAERSSFILSTHYKDLGLTRPQFRVMAIVEAFPHTSSTKVSEALIMDKSSVARAIDNLVDRGLLLRERNPDDLRTNLLALTSDGQELFTQLGELASRIQSRFLNSLSEDEQAALDRILIKFEGALNQLEHESPVPIQIANE